MTYYEQQVKEPGARFQQKEYLYTQLSNAKQYIRTHCCDSITIEHIASVACFSKFHFLRLFKKYTLKTPAGYRVYMKQYGNNKSGLIHSPFFLHYKKAIFKPGMMIVNSHL